MHVKRKCIFQNPVGVSKLNIIFVLLCKFLFVFVFPHFFFVAVNSF